MNKELLEDFIKYCEAHPEERFWQALRNWSKADAICVERNWGEVGDDGRFTSREYVDTFYWEDKSDLPDEFDEDDLVSYENL